jgi:hypothetical protein
MAESVRGYRGRRSPDAAGEQGHWAVEVFDPDGTFEELDPAPSLAVRNHSPTGYGWGFGGSGPAQLALALLVDAVGVERATRFYQRYKFDVVAQWPQSCEWTTSAEEIRQWVADQERRQVEEHTAAAAAASGSAGPGATFCGSCNARILWKRTVNGRSIPIDPDPHPSGNLVLDVASAEQVRTLTREELQDPVTRGLPRYLSHFATCPAADAHRRPGRFHLA